MSVAVWIAIAVLGGTGACARFVFDGAIASRAGRAFPYGTLAVNLSGALLLGVAAGAALSTTAYRLIGTATIGSYTTFSTWMLETHRLQEDGQSRWAASNVAISLAVGVAVAWVGRKLGEGL